MRWLNFIFFVQLQVRLDSTDSVLYCNCMIESYVCNETSVKDKRYTRRYMTWLNQLCTVCLSVYFQTVDQNQIQVFCILIICSHSDHSASETIRQWQSHVMSCKCNLESGTVWMFWGLLTAWRRSNFFWWWQPTDPSDAYYSISCGTSQGLNNYEQHVSESKRIWMNFSYYGLWSSSSSSLSKTRCSAVSSPTKFILNISVIEVWEPKHSGQGPEGNLQKVFVQFWRWGSQWEVRNTRWAGSLHKEKPVQSVDIYFLNCH